MTAQTVSPMPAAERAVYGTRKHRAEDLVPGDVIRNSHGKWARIVRASTDGLYVTCWFDSGVALTMRDVNLVEVQVAKPS